MLAPLAQQRAVPQRQVAHQERAVILAPRSFIKASDLGIAPVTAAPQTSLREARNRVERQVVIDALIRTRGNISRAAAELGISRRELHDLLEKDDLVTTWERTEQLETATTRDWEPLRTNLSLGDPSPRHWLMFISAVLVLLTVSYLL